MENKTCLKPPTSLNILKSPKNKLPVCPGRLHLTAPNWPVAGCQRIAKTATGTSCVEGWDCLIWYIHIICCIQHHIYKSYIYIYKWLIVSTPLKNISQLGWWHSQYMEKYKMFQTTNQIYMYTNDNNDNKWHWYIPLTTTVYIHV